MAALFTNQQILHSVIAYDDLHNAIELYSLSDFYTFYAINFLYEIGKNNSEQYYRVKVQQH